MATQETVQEIAGVDLEFYDRKYDSALLGFVESGGYRPAIMPCYGYQALKAVLFEDADVTESKMFNKLDKIVSPSMLDEPMLLMKLSRDYMWNIIRKYKMPRWDMLDSAIIGIGYMYRTPECIVYNKEACVEVLMNNQISCKGEQYDRETATSFLNESVFPIDLGEYTPAFLTVVK